PALVAKPFDGEATIQPLGIQLGVTVPNLSEPEEWRQIRPFWGPGGEGTTASLLVTIPSGGIVSIDTRASALTAFRDDTGKDLLAATQQRQFGSGRPVQKMDIRGANREYATVFVSAPGRPAENATSVSVAGNIGVVRGGGSETYESPNFALDEEGTFTLGELSYQWAPNTFEPGMIPRGRAGENLMIGTMTILGSQAAHDAVIQTQFFSETGAPIRAEGSGWSSREDGGYRTVEKPYGFPIGTKTVKMVVTAMTDRELVTIPFEATVALNGANLASEAVQIKATRSELPPAPPVPLGSPNALNNRAWAYVQQGTNLEEAVKLAKQAVELVPESPVFLDTLAWAYLKTEQYADALAVFEKIFGMSPDFGSSWDALFELAQSEVPESDFMPFSERLSELLPDVPPMRMRRNMMMSIWYRNQGNLKMAEELFARSGFADEKFWQIAGPFPQQYRQGLSVAYDAETEILSFGLDGNINPEKTDWHSIDDGRQDGYLNFQKTLSPSEEVVAYALIDLVSETELDANLRIGSDDGVKVWLNGKPVWLNNANRSAAIDQDTVAVHLRKGRNRLLVKISQGTGDWGFYLRVTDFYGKPIPEVRFVPSTIHSE
ncbi:MAG: tetratricopeptide repeat protein, partial [Candidatus Poribacteria bacterium]